MAKKENKPVEAIVEDIMMKPLEEEITQSYIDYAMSVIVSRALPDARDGLKPVHRRILYAMSDMKLTHGAKYRKCAAVVGEVLGKYHPHGDTSVYDAMVRLAQPFSMRYPMVDGQGNFWSIDGDSAAAMRYTEAKMTKIAEEMLQDITQDTVIWRDNYDQSRQEPTTLPTKFPYILCNGTMGIAVGMATNMPPHHLGEVIDACLALIDDAELDVAGIMEHIKGPDFPTAWIMYDSVQIQEVYERGRWPITVRGRVSFEKVGKKGDIDALIITELPYQVNKANLVAKIGDLVNQKKIDGITDLTDESSKGDIKIVITLKKGVWKEEVLARIYKYTDLQTNFNVNNVALVEQGKQPKPMNIKQLLVEFVDFRRRVVLRRSHYQLDRAKKRLHILQWLKRATDILDEVIATIRWSQTRDEAKKGLMSIFEFSAEQAEYILMLRLQTLVGLEIQKILDEIGDKEEMITYLESIINDPKKLDGVVIDELIYMKDTYGDKRKTEISNDVESVYSLNNMIKQLKKLDGLIKEPVLTWIGSDYKIKVLYQSRILNIPEGTWTLTKTHNQDKMIAISDTWELVIQRLKDLWKFSVKSDAMDVVKEYGLKSHLLFSETMEFDFDYLVFVTNKNNIKKVKKELLLKFRKFPTTIMWLEHKEKIIKVLPVKEEDKIWVISEQGKMLIYREKFVRAMGKTAGWVKAIDLGEGDFVADIFVYQDEPFIFIHDDQNGKLVSAEDIFEQKVRGEMKRGQTWVVCAKLKRGQKLRWAIAIYEWAVNLKMENGRIDLYDSDKMDLVMPEDPLAKITNGKIIKMRRPWSEKETTRKDEETKDDVKDKTDK